MPMLCCAYSEVARSVQSSVVGKGTSPAIGCWCRCLDISHSSKCHRGRRSAVRGSVSVPFSPRWPDPWEKTVGLVGHKSVGSESHQHHHIRWDHDSRLQPKAMSWKSRKLPGCLAGQDSVCWLRPHLRSLVSEMASLQSNSSAPQN